jgi:hypothetical protein
MVDLKMHLYVEMVSDSQVRDMYVDRPRIDEPKTLDPQKSKKENEGSWQNVSDEA